MLARLRSQEGFGLVELLIAMMLLNIALLALLGAFSSGAVALRRGARISTASALADAQLELYRAGTYSSIGVEATTLPLADTVYTTDPAFVNDPAVRVTVVCTTPTPPECDASRDATGADGRLYRLDTYIVYDYPRDPNGQPVGRQLKKVTVVVRDAGQPAERPYTRSVSTFDASTG